MNKDLNLNDEIFSLNKEFNADPRTNKINGGIGIYLDNLGKPFVIPIVKKIASSLDFSNFNYLPISGDPVFLEESAKLIFGKSLYHNYQDKLIKQGTVGGTNGLFIWGSLIKLDNKKPNIIIGNPTWENHKKIFNDLGFNIIEYNHIDKNKFNLNKFEEILDKNKNSYILLHGGMSHNPTGINPNKNDWLRISEIMKRNHNYICFDSAYLGIGDNIENDIFPLKLFLEKNIPMSIIISFSKNMSLYQHRTGCLTIFEPNQKNKTIIESKLKYIFRIINSNPPAFGEIIVNKILSNLKYKKEWLNSLTKIRKDILQRRKMFDKYTNHKFSEVLNHKGLFSLLPLTSSQVEILKKEYGIYLLSNGRINFGGIAIDKIPQLSKALLSL